MPLLAAIPLLWRFVALAAFLAALAGLFGWFVHTQREVGRAEIRADWNAERLAQEQAAQAELLAKAKEGQRRLDRQEENQRVQNEDLARARAAAARADAVANRLRSDHAAAARDWAARLADFPSLADLQTAGAALGVCTDLLGRAVDRARLLASVADASRAAGLKCERDYEALIPSLNHH